jgi:type I restriction enzyme S subunit
MNKLQGSTTTMSADTQKRTPKLRFPKFHNAHPWEVYKLGEKCVINCGGTPSREKADYWNGTIPWISAKYISDDHHIIGQEYITELGLEKSSTNIALKGSTLVVTRVSVGKFAFSDKNHAINQDITSLYPKDDIIPRFLFYSTYQLASIIKRNAIGTGIRGVTQSFISNLDLFCCSLQEQTKIADCLSSLDELIGLQKQKLDALKQHKQGLMQQLFPPEGETVPRLRFPEFQHAGNWDMKKLGEITTTFSGGTPNTSNKSFYGGNIPFIRSAEIHLNSTELFLTQEGLKNSSAKLVEKNDILLALYGANSGDVALSKIHGSINQAILCLRSPYNPFIYHYLTYKKQWIISTYIQGGQGNLSGEIIKSIQIALPSLPEQQKIAEFLNSIDEQIAVASQQLEILEQHKQGLMQQLFPASNEV